MVWLFTDKDAAPQFRQYFLEPSTTIEWLLANNPPSKTKNEQRILESKFPLP